MQLNALFRLGFPTAPHLKCLTLLHTITRWLVIQKARRHAYKALRPIVGTRFQVLFHSPHGVLFTFPSRYFFTIGYQVVFSLGRWSSQLPTRFHVSRGTLDQNSFLHLFVYRTFTFYGGVFQNSSTKNSKLLCSVRNPRIKDSGLGSSPFARRYLGNRCFFLFLRVLRCFSSPGYLP